MKIKFGVAFSIAAASLAFAQTATRTFEVASLKLDPPPERGQQTISIGDDPGRLDWKGVPLKFIISRAYEVQDFQISGPDWMATQRFSLSAKLPEGATDREVPEMLRALLADRFKLQVHKEPREMQVYALTVAKSGLKIKQADRESGMVRIGTGRMMMIGAPMTQFTAALARMLERPVLDETGLTGFFDIRLEFTPEGNSGDSAAPSIFTAVQEQAGLRLDSRKAPVEQVVVDRVEKLPTEN